MLLVMSAPQLKAHLVSGPHQVPTNTVSKHKRKPLEVTSDIELCHVRAQALHPACLCSQGPRSCAPHHLPSAHLHLQPLSSSCC